MRSAACGDDGENRASDGVLHQRVRAVFVSGSSGDVARPDDAVHELRGRQRGKKIEAICGDDKSKTPLFGRCATALLCFG